SFRREKYVPRGGPDGGDGGKGGDVIFEASHSVRNLKELGRRRIYKADRGRHGQGSNKHGRNAEDLVLKVPVGTQLTRLDADVGEESAGDLTEAGMRIVVAGGGSGGWGNARFATSTHQAPRIAQRGQAGQELRLRLDLKLLADVGIVGLPNSGKSTLLTQISAARPKIGAYPFTTLEPNLGVADVGWDRFVVADIPGLIEGAHEGAGLGLDFLRHIERTRVTIHLLDGSSDDPWRDLETVNEELREYGEGLAERPQIVVINKIDIPEVAARRAELEKAFRKRRIELHFMSAAGGEGVREVMEVVAARLAETRSEDAAIAEPAPLTILRPKERGVRVHREDGAYRVEGERETAFAEMMPVETEEGRAELWRRFQRWGVTGALRRAGAREGDRVLLGRVDLEMER
ncbi:MAG TPA: GTPase ObgE, partial [Dehalococcoidia bacterium]